MSSAFLRRDANESFAVTGDKVNRGAGYSLHGPKHNVNTDRINNNLCSIDMCFLFGQSSLDLALVVDGP